MPKRQIERILEEEQEFQRERIDSEKN